MQSLKNLVKTCFAIIFILLNNHLISAQEPDNISEMRSNWFMGQRGFPNGNVVSDSAYYNAVLEANNLFPPNDYFNTNGTWYFMGPQPLISGVANPNHVAGKVSIVAFDPTISDGSKYYVGGADGGLFLTTNSGSSWTELTNNIENPTLSSGAFAIKPNNSQVLLYGTGVGDYCFLFNYRGLGLFRSTNGGANWTQITSGIPIISTQFSKIAFLTGSNTIVFAATNTGLYRSADAGLNWIRIIPAVNEPPKVCTDVAFTNDGTDDIVIAVGYSGSNGGVGYNRSTDAGLSFSNYSPGDFGQHDKSLLAISPDAPNRVYGLTVYNGDAQFYVSNNYGISFIPQGSPFPPHDCQSNQNLIMTADPENFATVFYGNVEFKKSTNEGGGWEYIPRGHDDMHAICFNPNNTDQMLLGNDGGLYYSPDQFVNLDQKNDHICFTQIFRISSNHFSSRKIGIGITDEGIAFIDETPQSTLWTYGLGIENGDGTNIYYSPASGSGNKRVASVGINGDLAYWTSDSQNEYFWPSEGVYGYVDGLGNDWIKPFAGHKNQANVFYTARRNDQSSGVVNIFKSNDNGANYIWHGQITNTQNPDKLAPTNLEYAPTPSNASIAYITLGNITDSYQNKLLKSIDGGVTWALCNTSNIPNRYFSRIAVDPTDANLIYLTLSGFGSGHVYKSTNSGSNWQDISSPPPSGSGRPLPNIPVNDIVVKDLEGNQNRIIIATDRGVYTTLEPDYEHTNGFHWSAFADGLPNSIAMDLDWNTFEGQLRVATFGRGVWESTLLGTIYINNEEYLTSFGEGLNIAGDIDVQANACLKIQQGCTIKMPAGKKIIVEDGGKIEVTSNDPVYFTSQSGEWGGIEFRGSSTGTIKNCVFSNTETPISITNTGDNDTGDIFIDYCTFNSGSVTVSGRDSVTISHCTFNSPSQTTGTAVCIVYGDVIVLSKNTINNSNVGISVSNSSPFLDENSIYHGQEVNVSTGISLDNSYGAKLNKNIVSDYPIGLYLNNASPVLYNNTFTGSATAVYAEYNSSPRIKPDDGPGGTIWDAGKDTLGGNTGIYIHSSSIPELDGGCNVINGSTYSIDGDIESCFMSIYYLNARYNSWSSFSENVCDAEYTINPTGCSGGQGGGIRGDKELINDPPPPIIINYGRGIYDTIRITNRNIPVTEDNLMYSEAKAYEFTNNYQQAIAKYESIIANYQDSLTASNSMKRLMHCYEKVNANSQQYSALRSYYQALVQANPTDTGFVNIAQELASKCLVKMGTLPDAITEYEGIVQHSSDSLKVLCAELNIIETYMIMEQGPMARFTGSIQSLKPSSVLDGIRLINEKLHRINNIKKNNPVPTVFSLSQNYPNPFNPITKINYALPNKSNVTIKVFDILGRLVKTLVNETKDAGYYTITFDGTGLASGIYFYTIEADKFRDSKKMVLVK